MVQTINNDCLQAFPSAFPRSAAEAASSYFSADTVKVTLLKRDVAVTATVPGSGPTVMTLVALPVLSVVPAEF